MYEGRNKRNTAKDFKHVQNLCLNLQEILSSIDIAYIYYCLEASPEVYSLLILSPYGLGAGDPSFSSSSET